MNLTKLTNVPHAPLNLQGAECLGYELLTETLGEEERSPVAKDLNYHITEEQTQSSVKAAGDPSSSEEPC